MPRNDPLVLLQCRVRGYQIDNLQAIADAEYDGNRSFALRQILDFGFERWQQEHDVQAARSQD